jgi:DNA-binding CsgD family transcriptional regulator
VALIGRADECSEIDRLLDATREGLSGVLVLRGEAGIGKTALLEYAVESAPDFRVVRVVGIESEMEFGFAALHKLLSPFLRELATLPAPQRGALQAAFGLSEGPEPNRFMIGLATLTLMSETDETQPLLCVVDDAQWLDQESATALAFVARRLYAERVALLFAIREPTEAKIPFEGLAECNVGRLTGEAAREVLVATAGPLPQRVVERVLAEAEGNPLALVEIASDLGSDPLIAEEHLLDPLPLSQRLEARYLRRVRALPEDAQLLLLLAAAEPRGDTQLLERGAALLGLDFTSSSRLVEDLLSVRPGTSFRHPLIRSAVYYGSTEADRRRVHTALGAAADGDRDSDCRAWHRAAAVVDVDEEVAVDLEHASQRALHRGGYATAGAFLTRAAQLTPVGDRRSRRLLAAASVECAAGAPARAQRLLVEARPGIQDGLERARALRLEGEIHYAQGHALETTSIMLTAARALYPLDARLARETVLAALTAAYMAGPFDTAGGTRAVARAARAMPVPAGSRATVGDLLLDALTTFEHQGLTAAAPLLRQSVAAVQSGTHPAQEEMHWLIFGGWAAGPLGDIEAMHVLATRSVQLAREQGALVVLTRALHNMAIAELLIGSLSDAESQFAAGRNLVTPQSTPVNLGDLLVLAWRDSGATVRAGADLKLREAAETGQGWMVAYIEYALTTLELSVGRYRDALVHVNAALAADSYLLSAVLPPDAVEAAVRSNEPHTAATALAVCEERARVSGTPLALGLYARSQALVASDETAEGHYQEAIRTLRQVRGTAHIARTHLHYGEWLRRRGRRIDAREQLRTALDMFEAMGAKNFAQRSRSELEATGEKVRARSVETRNELTSQEAEVARLAAAGATNAEIGGKMFISPNTVDYHLRKVYRKLGVTSRRQLAGVERPGVKAPRS